MGLQRSLEILRSQGVTLVKKLWSVEPSGASEQEQKCLALKFLRVKVIFSKAASASCCLGHCCSLGQEDPTLRDPSSIFWPDQTHKTA